MQNIDTAFAMTCDYLKSAAELGAWLASNEPETDRIRKLKKLLLEPLKLNIYQTVGREMET